MTAGTHSSIHLLRNTLGCKHVENVKVTITNWAVRFPTGRVTQFYPHYLKLQQKNYKTMCMKQAPAICWIYIHVVKPKPEIVAVGCTPDEDPWVIIWFPRKVSIQRE